MATTNIQSFSGDVDITSNVLMNGEVFIKKDGGTKNIGIGYLAGSNTQGASAVAIGETAGHMSQGDSAVAVGRQAGVTGQGNFATAVGYFAGYSLQGGAAIAVGNLAGYSAQGDYTVAVGRLAGETGQGELAIAVGNQAGQSYQGVSAIAVGFGAGYTSQGDYALAVGKDAGYSAQASYAVALGYHAGYSAQGVSAVAVGVNAGKCQQGVSAVAVGEQAGFSGQNNYATAIGYSAGVYSQGSSAVAVGDSAGYVSQQANTVAMGYFAGYSLQGTSAVAVGRQAGSTSQGSHAIAIGTNTGRYSQGTNALAIGESAGRENQESYAIAMGHEAGYVNQGSYAIAVGDQAGLNTQGTNAVAVGYSAGQSVQGINSIAVGRAAGNNTQGGQATAVGDAAGQSSQGGQATAVGVNAGNRSQGSYATAIGSSAGYSAQGINAIAIGANAGSSTQGSAAIAMGVNAANITQGSYAIAIGESAGRSNQGGSAIAIGLSTGQVSQDSYAIAIGKDAGYVGQNVHGIAVGTNAGFSAQGSYAVAMGWLAGYNNQGVATVAVGTNAGQVSQGLNAVAVGTNAGSNAQGIAAVAVGELAGHAGQNNYATAMGHNAGYSAQGSYTVAIGYSAGNLEQKHYGVAIGYTAGSQQQSCYATAVGPYAGQFNQYDGATAIGFVAGQYSQGSYATAVGDNAGRSSQGIAAVAIGQEAGRVGQNNYAIAMGNNAGSIIQGIAAVAIGLDSGRVTQGTGAIAVGDSAASNAQGCYAVALGASAGYSAQGRHAVALGANAGQANQGSNSIAIGNETGMTSQGSYATAVGFQAGLTSQGSFSTAVGNLAGLTSQGFATIAVGTSAGETNQGDSAVAMGRAAGRYNQGDSAVAVGYDAGQTSQGSFSTAVGNQAGLTSQGFATIAVGTSAGETNQGDSAVAMGRAAGRSYQGSYAVAVGYDAGQSNQGVSTVAVGYQAGLTSQGTEATAMGYLAGQTSQGNYATAVGSLSGSNNQGSFAVAVGRDAGKISQGDTSVAVGYAAGDTSQGSNAVAVGGSAGYTGQGNSAIAVGFSAGQTSQGSNSVAVGVYAGNDTQRGSATAVGKSAGQASQSSYATALGAAAGYSNQGQYAVAIGYISGYESQGNFATAVGTDAGTYSQGNNATAIGYLSGKYSQKDSATAIGIYSGYSVQGIGASAVGEGAGYLNQGDYSVAVGAYAGQTNQHTNSIVLNATGSALNTVGTGRTYIKPLRVAAVASNVMTYDQTTGEVMDSGGLVANKFAVVSQQPPEALTGLTTTVTGHGKYVIDASYIDTNGAGQTRYAFYSDGIGWFGSGGGYDTDNGIADTTYSLTGSNGTTYYGAWVSLKLPYKTTLRHILMNKRSDGNSSANPSFPSAVNVFGSNDNGVTKVFLKNVTGLEPGYDVVAVIDANAQYNKYYFSFPTLYGTSDSVRVGQIRLFTESFTVDGGVVSTTAASGLDVGYTEHPVEPMTDYTTYVEGHGTYEASASSYYVGNALDPWQAFDRNTGTRFATNASDGAYNQTTGIFTTTTTTPKTIDIGGTRYNGHWLQVKTPYPIVLSHSNIYPTDGLLYRAPVDGVILGSNDGTNWYKLTEFSGKTYTTSTWTRIAVNATTPYQYFRLSITKIGTGELQYGITEFTEWRLFAEKSVTRMENVHISGALSSETLQTSHIKWPKVPLKANGSEGYVASQSSSYFGDAAYTGWHAFEDKTEYIDVFAPSWASRKWTFIPSTGLPDTSNCATFDGISCEWLNIKCPQKFALSYFTISERKDIGNNTYGPKDGYLYATNDGIEWTRLCEFAGLTYSNGDLPTRVDVQAHVPYSEYRLLVTKIGNIDVCVINELQLFESTLGVGTSATTAKLTVEGGLGLAKGSQVFAGSDVVMELPRHERPLTKYPETSSNTPTRTISSLTEYWDGYEVTMSSRYNSSGDYNGYYAFDNDITSDVNWISTGAPDTYDGSGIATSQDSINGVNGSYLTLKLRNPIKPSYVKLYHRPTSASSPRAPKSGFVYGSNDGTYWRQIGEFSYPTHTNEPKIIQLTSTYSYVYLTFQVTSIFAGDAVAIRELEYYGTEEGDESVDVVHRSVPNKPSQQQLEVYYEARDSNSYSFADSSNVYDLSGSGVKGTLTGGVGFDAEYNAFTFDGVNDYINATVSSVSGDYIHTISFWFYIESYPTVGAKYIYGLGDGSPYQNLHCFIYNRLLLIGSWTLDYPIENIPERTWVHVTSTYTGGGYAPNTTAIAYVNGIPTHLGKNVSSGTDGTILQLDTNTLYIGGYGGTYFNGSIANFRLYSKVLNADQVRELYEYDAERFGHRQNLVALHKGNFGVGVTNPTSRFEVAGADGLQEYPPRAMTGDETYIEGHGVFRASASSYLSNNRVYKAFDGNYETFFHTQYPYYTENGGTYDPGQVAVGPGSPATGTTLPSHELISGYAGEYITLELPQKIKPVKVQIHTRVDLGLNLDQTQSGEELVLVGSNDGSTWEIIMNHTVTSYPNDNTEPYFIDVSTTKYYRHLGLICTNTGPIDSIYNTAWSMTKLAFFGTPAPSSLEDGHLTLGKALTLPRVSGHGAGAETPRAGSLVVHYDTTVDSVVSGTTVVDISGSGTNGTLTNGAIYDTVERALTFDGVNDILYNSGIGGGWSDNISHTISFFVKINSPSSGYGGGIFNLYNTTSTNNNYSSVSIQMGASGYMTFYHYGNDYLYSYPFHAGVFYHMACVYNGSPTTQKVYVNGVNLSLTSTTGSDVGSTLLLGTSPKLSIGGDYGRSNYYTDGSISNFKLWNVALTPEEVAAEYALGRTGKSLNVTDTAVCLGGTVPRAQLDVRGSGVFSSKLAIGATTTPSGLGLVELAASGGNSVLNLKRTDAGTEQGALGFVNLYSNLVASVTSSRSGTHGGILQFNTATDSAGLGTTDPYLVPESMCILANGNVGIGVASPGYILDVQSGSTGADVTMSRLYSGEAATGVSSTGLRLEKGAGYGGLVKGFLSQGVGSGLSLHTLNGGTDLQVMTLRETGNVGIGLTSPLNALHVSSDNYATFARGTGAAGWSGIRLGIPYTTNHDAYCSVIESYNDAVVDYNSVLRFKTSNGDNAAATERMRIDSAGNVGIGTNNPRNQLHIYKAAADQLSGLFIEKPNSASGTAQVTFGVNDPSENPGVAKAGIFFERTAVNGRGDLKFCVDNTDDANDVGVADARMTITRTGNVGIGTDAPNVKLDVRSGDGESSSGWISGVFGPATGLTTNPRVVMGTLSNVAIIGSHTGNLGAWANLAINPTSTSNVAVGTLTPTARFQVYNQLNAGTGIHLQTARVDNAGYYSFFKMKAIDFTTNPIFHFKAYEHLENVIGGGYPMFLVEGSQGGHLLNIQQNGNVGIGTASPSGGKLDIYGDGQKFRIRDSSDRQLVMGTDANSPWIGTASNDDLRIVTNNNEKIRVTSGGNVGIGTASPVGKLHLYQSSVAGNLLDDKRTNITTGNNQQSLNYTHYSSVAQGATQNPDNSRGLWIGNMVDENDVSPSGANFAAFTNSFQFYGVADQTKYDDGLSFVSNTDRLNYSDGEFVKVMRINADGNVGIGTTNPAYTLDVNGTVNTGALTLSYTSGAPTLQFKSTENVFRQASDWEAYFTAREASIERYADKQVYASGSGPLLDTTHRIKFGYSDTYINNTGYYPTYHEMHFEMTNSTDNNDGTLTRIMTLRDNGNVGIGVASPAYILDVQSGSTGADVIMSRLYSGAAATGVSSTGLRLEKGVGYGGLVKGFLSQGVGSGLSLHTLNGGTDLQVMTLTHTGNVGIGTISPDGLLDINGLKTKFSYEYRFQDAWISNNNQTFTIPVTGGDGYGIMLVEAKVVQVGGNSSSPRVARVKGMISNYGTGNQYMTVLEGENISAFESYIVGTAGNSGGTFTLKYQPEAGYLADVVCRLYLKIWYGGFTTSFGNLTRTDTGSNSALTAPSFNPATQTFGGNVGIGTNAPIAKLDVHDASGVSVSTSSVSSNLGASYVMIQSTGSIYRNYDSDVSGAGIHLTGNAVVPAGKNGGIPDGTIALGGASYRWAQIYSSVGSISTSDLHKKRDITDISQAERRVANHIRTLIKNYRFKDAYNQKGEDARIHTGVIAQEIEEAFVAEGLDARRYGLFCSDDIYEVDGDNKLYVTSYEKDGEKYYTTIHEYTSEDEDAELRDDGFYYVNDSNIYSTTHSYTENDEGVVSVKIFSGKFVNSETPGATLARTVYAIRYEELLAFVVSNLASLDDIERLEARITALENV